MYYLLCAHRACFWCKQPLVNMYNTIRYDKHDLALQRRSSLDVDLASLQRMVRSFASRPLALNDDEIAGIVENVSCVT